MINIDKIKEDVIKSLIKKAKGYSYNEECSEFVYTDEGEKLQKKKVTTKVVPPDITALKNALDLLKDDNNLIESLTDEELNDQINTILKELESKKKNKGL